MKQSMRISAMLMAGMLALTGCSKDKKEDDKKAAGSKAVMSGATAQAGTANDTIVAHFGGNTENLDQQLAGSSLTASFTGDEWISPEVNFNINLPDYISSLAEDSLMTLVVYNLPDFFQVEDFNQSNLLANEIFKSLAGTVESAVGGDNYYNEYDVIAHDDGNLLGQKSFCADYLEEKIPDSASCSSYSAFSEGYCEGYSNIFLQNGTVDLDQFCIEATSEPIGDWAYRLGLSDRCDNTNFSLPICSDSELNGLMGTYCNYYQQGYESSESCPQQGIYDEAIYWNGFKDGANRPCNDANLTCDNSIIYCNGLHDGYNQNCGNPDTGNYDQGFNDGQNACNNDGYLQNCEQYYSADYCEGFSDGYFGAGCVIGDDNNEYQNGYREGQESCLAGRSVLCEENCDFCNGLNAGYLDAGCSFNDDDDDDDDDDDNNNTMKMIKSVLGKMPVETIQNLARGLLAYVGSNFNGFVLSDSEALLNDHVVSALLYLWDFAEIRIINNDAAALVYNLAQLLLSLQLNDGYISYDNRFLTNVEERADVIRAGTTYAITLDGNFSCQERLDIDSIYDLVAQLKIAGIVFGDLESLVNLIAPNDINDGCLAETREKLQAWLDGELGKGVAVIPVGGVSTSALNFLEKTNITFELAQDLHLDSAESLSLKDVQNDYLDNLLAYIHADTEQSLPVKTIKMPAAIVKDYAGRPNRAYSFKLGNLLGSQGVLDYVMSKMSLPDMKLTPEALPFDKAFKKASDNDGDIQHVSMNPGVPEGDSKLLKGEHFAICFTEGSILDNNSCNSVSYYLQIAGAPLECVGIKQSRIGFVGGTVSNNKDAYSNCLEIAALADAELPLNISIPAGAVQTIFGVANSEPANFVIDDVVLPEVASVFYNLTDMSTARTGLVENDRIAIYFNKNINLADVVDTLKASAGPNIEIINADNVILINVKDNIADGATLLTIPADAVSDVDQVSGTSRNMAEDYVLKVNMAKIRADYLRDNNPIKIYSDSANHQKDIINISDDIYLKTFDSAIDGYNVFDSYWYYLVSNSIKHPENINSECPAETIFSINNMTIDNSRINIKVKNGCLVELKEGAEAIVFRPMDAMDDNGIGELGFDISNFTLTLSREELNKYVKTFDAALVKNYSVSAGYKYSPFNPCGDGLLHENDIIEIDLGANGPFLMDNISIRDLTKALAGKLGLSESAINCNNIGTSTGAGFNCLLEDSMTDAIDGVQTIELVLDSKENSGRVTINLPLPNSYTVKAYTRNGSGHDGKLVKGEQVVIEAACTSNSLTGALEILVNDKIKDLHLVARDIDSYDHRHRWIFAYGGDVALDISSAINVEIPALYEKNGTKLPAQTVSIAESAVNDAVFTYVAGSAKGNSATFKAAAPVANGSYALSANGFDSVAGQNDVLFSKDEANAKNDNLFIIRQYINELMTLDAVKAFLEDL